MSGELQMVKDEKFIAGILSSLTDEDFKYRAGVKDWCKRYYSYSKILNEHSTFAYDIHGLYLIDLLEMTYSSDYDHLFFRTPCLFQDRIFKSRYNIDKDLSLIQVKGKSINYHLQYIIEYNGKQFGCLYVHKNNDLLLSKIHVKNDVPYTESPLTIIVSLVDIAKRLNLVFKNHSGYDIAHDSQHNYYEDICRFQYKTDFCDHYAHEHAGTMPEFTFYGKRRKFHHEINATDTKAGTISIGSKHSPTSVKIYPKTPDAVEKGKSYITELHAKHFGNTSCVYRTEVHANSEMFNRNNEFGKRGYDLIDLLNYENLKENFFIMLGNKLKFKSLTSTGYDKNRNPIYEKINLLNFSFDFKYTTILLDDERIESTEQKEIIKFKEIIYGYLNNDFRFTTVLRFINRQKKAKHAVQIMHLRSGLEMALRNYKGKVSETKKRRLDSLIKYIASPKTIMSTGFGVVIYDVWSFINFRRTFI
jgi:hypothetical protein